VKRLSVQLLGFSVLLLFLPIGSFLYLDTFEKQLLENLERAMVQEGRVMASALAGKDLEIEALRILTNLAGRVESRIRIVDETGRPVADSALNSVPAVPVEGTAASNTAIAADGTDRSTSTARFVDSTTSLSDAPDPAAPERIEKAAGSARDELIYRVVVPPVRRVIDLLSAPDPALPSAEFYSGQEIMAGPEITAALAGRYGAATRVSTGGQRSVTLYSAIPILSPDGTVAGAVLVSRSTYRILDNLYQVRLEIITIFLYSLVAAVIVTILLSLTITRPLRKLRDRSEELLLPGSNLHDAVRTGFPSLHRRDEIGGLSRSLAELWKRLESRIAVIDDFSADILHEVKNPLAAIRSSAEVIATEINERTDPDPAELRPFLESILRETGRIDRLLGELREITLIDARLAWEETEPVMTADLVTEMVVLYRNRTVRTGTGDESDITIAARIDPEAVNAVLQVNRDRLRQVLGNILDNALDFTKTSILVRLALSGGSPPTVEIAVDDDGPGISPADLEHVFNRFFSGRTVRNDHDGLGLAVSHAIVEAYGGTLVAENLAEEGARFRIRLPAASRAATGDER